MPKPEIKYQSQFNPASKLVLVDADSPNEYWVNNLNHPIYKNLNMKGIFNRLKKHMDEFEFYKAESFIDFYFSPSQNLNEIKERQDVVKAIYEDEKTKDLVKTIICSAKGLRTWTPKFFVKTRSDIEERSAQVKDLVEMVESSLELKTTSSRLHSLKYFAKRIAEKKEYQQLKAYDSACGEQTGKTYDIVMKDLSVFGYSRNEDGTISSPGLTQVFADLTRSERRNEINLLSSGSRKKIYSALTDLQDLLHSILIHPELEGFIDKKEVKTFKLEQKLSQGIQDLGSTGGLYRRQARLKPTQEFFLSQLGEIIYHIDNMVANSLQDKMEILNVRTNNLEKQFAFYYSLAKFAEDMAMKSAVCMPKLNPKEERKQHIVQGNIPSFTLKRIPLIANDVYSDENEFMFSVTGANGNGKSSYARLIGQSQILAQVGSYIAAKSAKISLVDGLFVAFKGKDKPGEKAGSGFQSSAAFVRDLFVPRNYNYTNGRILSDEEIIDSYEKHEQRFLTPWSLALFDELGTGTDINATLDVLEKLTYGSTSLGTTAYIFHHCHTFAEKITEGEFPHAINLGAIIENEKGKEPVLTKKMKRGLHSKTYGELVINEVGLTKKNISQGVEILKKLGFTQ